MAMATGSKDKVDYVTKQVEVLRSRWNLPETLLGGTKAMRAAGEKYLPKEDKEPHDAYTVRLNRSFLYNAYGDTLTKTVAKPFQKPIDVQNLPESLEYLLNDVDTNGTDLTNFGKSLFRDMLHFGICYVMVDYTRIPQNERGERLATIAEEKASGARVVMERITPTDILGVRHDDSGELTQVRIKEVRVEPDGLYGEQEVHYVRVYEKLDNGRIAWAKYRKPEDQDKFILTDDRGVMIGTSRIPLISMQASPDTICPVYERLAEVNLAHWQSESDQRNILRVARFAILFFKGLTKEEAEEDIKIGPFNSFTSSSDEADGKYIEHSGSAIQAGERDITKLEARMEALGMQPFVERSADSTATGKKIDEGRGQALILEWVRALELALYEAFSIVSEWTRVELPEDLLINVYSDFEILVNRGGDVEFLLKCLVSGKMTLETFWAEVARRGLMSETFDPEVEARSVRDTLDPGTIGFEDEDEGEGEGEEEDDEDM
jgi:hypothetical protein